MKDYFFPSFFSSFFLIGRVIYQGTHTQYTSTGLGQEMNTIISVHFLGEGSTEKKILAVAREQLLCLWNLLSKLFTEQGKDQGFPSLCHVQGKPLGQSFKVQKWEAYCPWNFVDIKDAKINRIPQILVYRKATKLN